MNVVADFVACFSDALRVVPMMLTAFEFDSAVWTSRPRNRPPPLSGTSSFLPIMSMLSTATVLRSGRSGFSVYAHAPSSPRSSEFHAANSTERFGRWPRRAAMA